MRIVKYSFNKETEINVDSYKMDIKHMKFLLNIKGKPLNMQSSLIGSHNIYNIMAAAGATFKKAGLENIKRAIENFKKVEGRLEKIYNNKFIVIVDYAHTTDSLEKTLEVLNKLKQRQIITVFGAGGDRDKGKRPMMGEVVERLSDKYIITSDNPRFEDPGEIIKDVLKGIKNKAGAIVEADRAKAIARAIKMAAAGDIIFLAGKGHETYQAIKGKNIPFSDKEIALKEIKRKK
jgi:UDP-N-acetylmuramoyl-L-alanyl-D-glutamate--2,6-diaminopimelate ligase